MDCIFKNKKIKENSAFGTSLMILGVVLCFLPFSSWIINMEIEWVQKTIVTGCLIVGVGLLWSSVKVKIDSTKPYHAYQKNNREFDLEAHRKYQPYDMPKYKAIIGGYFQYGLFIKSFEYGSGIIKIKTNNGKSIEAPLGELKVLLVNDEYGMEHAAVKLSYNEAKLRFCHNDILFEDWEIEDMNRILSYAGEVKAGLATKLRIPSNFSKDAVPAMMRSNAADLNILASDVRMKFQKPIADQEEEDNGEIPEDFVMGIEKYAIDTRTEAEKQADTEIYQIIESLKSDNIQELSVSDSSLKDWIRNSSQKGFEKIFEAYSVILKNDRGCPKRQTLKQSAILKKLYTFYQDYMYLNLLESEYSWLGACCCIQIIGLSIIGLTLLNNLGFWSYVMWGVGILFGSLILGFLPVVLYTDKIEKLQKIFLDSRKEVISTGKMNSASIEIIRKKVKSAEWSYRGFKYFNWLLGIAFIVFLLWRSYH